MTRKKRLALTVALLLCSAAGPSPTDNVMRMTGSFACRSIPAAETLYVGRQDGDTIDVEGDATPANGAPRVVDDRYRYDVKGYWEVKTGFGSSDEFDGRAGPWTGTRWEVTGHGPEGGDERMTMELVEGADFRRTFAYRDSETKTFVTYRVDLCDRGDKVPPESACVAPEFPATIVEHAPFDVTRLPARVFGKAVVTVSLDATGAITSTAITRSDDARLNALALDAAQRSKYAPPIHDCKPAAGTKTFVVEITR